MTRTLLLLRHAKSSWDDPSLNDHERPLAPRGRRAAGLLAAHFEAASIHPDLVLCSSARRARDTLTGLMPAIEETEVRIESGLYTSAADDLLERVRTVRPDITTVLVIGHNPAIEVLASELAGSGDKAALARLRERYPTGALAAFDLDVEWHRLEPGRGRLVDLVLPRDLPR